MLKNLSGDTAHGVARVNRVHVETFRIYNALKILSNEAGKQQEESRYHQANYVMSVPGASHSKVAILLTSGYHSIQVKGSEKASGWLIIGCSGFQWFSHVFIRVVAYSLLWQDRSRKNRGSQLPGGLLLAAKLAL